MVPASVGDRASRGPATIGLKLPDLFVGQLRQFVETMRIILDVAAAAQARMVFRFERDICGFPN